MQATEVETERGALADEGANPFEARQFEGSIAAFLAFQTLLKKPMLSHCPSLSHAQIMVLLALDSFGPASMLQVADRCGVTREQASRTVKTLVEEGYVTRAHDPANRTVIRVSVTDKGRTLVAAAKTLVRKDLIEATENKLTSEEIEQLREASATVTRILSKAIVPPAAGEA